MTEKLKNKLEKLHSKRNRLYEKHICSLDKEIKVVLSEINSIDGKL